MALKLNDIQRNEAIRLMMVQCPGMRPYILGDKQPLTYNQHITSVFRNREESQLVKDYLEDLDTALSYHRDQSKQPFAINEYKTIDELGTYSTIPEEIKVLKEYILNFRPLTEKASEKLAQDYIRKNPLNLTGTVKEGENELEKLKKDRGNESNTKARNSKNNGYWEAKEYWEKIKRNRKTLTIPDNQDLKSAIESLEPTAVSPPDPEKKAAWEFLDQYCKFVSGLRDLDERAPLPEETVSEGSADQNRDDSDISVDPKNQQTQPKPTKTEEDLKKEWLARGYVIEIKEVNGKKDLKNGFDVRDQKTREICMTIGPKGETTIKGSWKKPDAIKAELAVQSYIDRGYKPPLTFTAKYGAGVTEEFKKALETEFKNKGFELVDAANSQKNRQQNGTARQFFQGGKDPSLVNASSSPSPSPSPFPPTPTGSTGV